MTHKLFALSLGFAALILVTQHSFAQGLPQQGTQCGDRDTVVGHLATKYGESRHGMGIAANNTVMEVFASDNTGSWTITVTLPTGVTCLVASGQGYEALTDALPAKGTPA